MTKFRTRLLIALILLIMAVLLGLGLLLGQLFKNYYLNEFNERLEKESNLIRTYIEDYGGINRANRKEIAKFGDMLNTRITIADTRGSVLYDSGKIAKTEPYEHNEIIKEAIKGKHQKRRLLQLKGGQEVHYFWETVRKDGKTEGFVILSTRTSELKDAYHQIWWILSLSLGLSLGIIILLGMRITRRYARPVESVANVAMELAKGNYRARTYVEDRMDETGLLSSSINVLARNLEGMVKAQEMHQERLMTLIENMGSGLLLIDSRGYINLVNKGYKEIFKINPSEYLYQLYYQVIGYKEISDMIEEIFMTEQKTRKQLLLPISIERRYFDVSGVPIIGTNNVWKGVLLVFHDITELKKLEQMRKDFVANVSHELKTPITSIKGFSETLLDGAMNDDKTLTDFLTIILKESDRLQELIQDLLDLSKIEQHGFMLNIIEFDVIDVLKEVSVMLKGKAEEKKVNLHISSEPDSLSMEGDPLRMKQIFINLLSNAITYTPPDGIVSVYVHDLDGKIRINIKDTGIGLEKEEIPRIFERFYRVDRARSRNSGGTGLGLAIVKHLVEAHRGKITVKSDIGHGSEFILTFRKVFVGKMKEWKG